MGRPLSQLHVNNGPSSLYPDLFSGSTSSTIQSMPFRRTFNLTDMDKSLMVNVSLNAMEELIKLAQSSSPLWIRSSADRCEVLNRAVYESIFAGVAKSPNVRIESSKDSSVVIVDSCLDLVDIFMDANKWMESFPNVISRATTVEVISAGLMGSRNGLLQMMYEELQVLSPLVPTREFYFLRFCQQIEQNAWAIVDVSYDFPQGPFYNSQSPVRRLPSGCIIEDMLNGHSKITWIEHTEIEDIRPIHNLYMKHVGSGLAFGAIRKLATLQRTCERLTYLMNSSNMSDLGGVITSPHGKRNLMKLSERMVKTFCSSINIVNEQQVTISGMNDAEVRATLQKCTDPGHPNSMVLSAETTISMPISSKVIFDFLRDEKNRPLWDVLSNYIPVQEVGHIACGSHPGNCISVLGAFNTIQNNKLILQESCIDSSGALVVYCPIDLVTINLAMSSEDPSFIPILSSGIAISPDAGENLGPGELSAGSLVTIVVRIIVSNLTSGKMSQELVNTANNLVNKVKAALR
ncbi:homeobox-leucine zipper protein HDG12-like [Apium graveolens]|uniref:homeobox-leucine zipper protein HDG12-like n=1 Tax=Apium graveolens TaxID=4045 RepID=UPI003D7A678C